MDVGFNWTIRSTLQTARASVQQISNIPVVIALINLVTMIPVNVVVRQRPGWAGPSSGKMDLTLLQDFPYLLMMIGLYPIHPARCLILSDKVYHRNVFCLLGHLFWILLCSNSTNFSPSLV